jgi:glycosyltransferase involved in cell wall biosynthesis
VSRPSPAAEGEGELAVIVAARNEAERLPATLAALRAAFPGASIWVADDASTDGTAEAAIAAGAQVVSRRRPHGKGANVSAAAEAALSAQPPPRLVLLCDADLGATAMHLRALVEAVERDECDLAIAEFKVREGGGFGVAVAFARWVIQRRAGYRARAPLSGQRAMRADVLSSLLPLAGGFGLEAGMTIDAARGGLRIREVELDLAHRATGRTPAGFTHRARQLLDIARAYWARR